MISLLIQAKFDLKMVSVEIISAVMFGVFLTSYVTFKVELYCSFIEQNHISSHIMTVSSLSFHLFNLTYLDFNNHA